MNAQHIAVAFGGPSPEHDVSILTGLQAAREIGRHGTEPTCLYWSKTGEWHRVDGSLEAAAFAEGVPGGSEHLRLAVGTDGGFSSVGRLGRAHPIPVEVVVNCCHGGPGEDGSLQAALDLAGISYTGPTVAGAALGMDKLAFGGLMQAAGLPVLPRRLLHPEGSDVGGTGASGPRIVKPRFGGSSIGVEVVEDHATAVLRLGANPHLRAGAVLEPYRPGLYDLNVAVRSWPELEVSAIERPVRSTDSSAILAYADKYAGGQGMASAPRELPAAVSDTLAHQLREIALQVGRLCQVRGVARVDFLSDGESLYVNELNTVPGSLARYLWVEPPLPFGALLADLVSEARSVPAAWRSTAGADGSVLRGAGSIAAKLV